VGIFPTFYFLFIEIIGGEIKMNREKSLSANKNLKKSVFSILIASILLLALMYPIAAETIIPKPAGYYGCLKIGGVDAPAGTTIIAKIGDEVRGNLASDKPGEYGSMQDPLWVKGFEDENNSATVTFYADGQICTPTVTWVSGNIERVDLDTNITFSMKLSAGWHLISIPWYIDPSDVQTIRETRGLNFSICGYNTTTCLWETPQELQPLHGYWIHMWDAGTIVFTKSMDMPEVPPSRELKTGWNLIGPNFGDADPLDDGLNATTVLSSLRDGENTTFSHLVLYNETTETYTTYDATVKWEDLYVAWDGLCLKLDAGQGCWISMIEDDLLTGRL
jgi:hypothetical protein